MENMEIWGKLNQPPKWALKEIKGGRLNGKTDINPQWRYQAATEIFGPCGVGWKYVLKRLLSEDGCEGQKFAFAEIMFYHKVDGEWSDPIPGIGGSMLVEKETKGLHASDEGYKMAVTDALSVAMKMLGVAADIYMGLWDGSKYKDKPDPAKKPPEKPKEKPKPTFEESIKPLQDKCDEGDFLALLGAHGYTELSEITDRDHQVAIYAAWKEHVGEK
jgi:hypothetical protein